MSSRAIAAVFAGAMVAAGAGGYVAVRQNRAEARAADAKAQPAAPVAATDVAVPAAPPAPAAAEPLATQPAAGAAAAPPVAPSAMASALEPTTATTAPAAAPAPESHAPHVDRPVPASRPASRPSRRGHPAAPAHDALAARRAATRPATAPTPPPTLPVAPVDAPVPPPASIPVESLPPEPPPPAPVYEELTLATDSVIGIRLETSVSSETAQPEDRVTAKVTRDVRVAGRTAVPSGAQLDGVVTVVERGGKFHDQARIGVRFTTLVYADGSRVPIQTETIFRVGEAPGNDATAKVGGGAVLGAILGAVLGGGKGAAVGGAIGAGGGTAAVAKGDRSEATLAAGTPLTVRLTAPATVTVERGTGFQGSKVLGF